MKQLPDDEFDKWLNAIEHGEEIPPTLAPDDAADLRFARRLFGLRAAAPQPVFPDLARSQQRLTGQRAWRLAAAALFVLLMLAAAISSSGSARAQILKSLGVTDDDSWFSPVPVIFEGRRYEGEAFNSLYRAQLQEVDLVLVPDEDEDGNPILYAFRSPEEARQFLIKTRGIPPGP